MLIGSSKSNQLIKSLLDLFFGLGKTTQRQTGRKIAKIWTWMHYNPIIQQYNRYQCKYDMYRYSLMTRRLSATQRFRTLQQSQHGHIVVINRQRDRTRSRVKTSVRGCGRAEPTASVCTCTGCMICMSMIHIICVQRYVSCVCVRHACCLNSPLLIQPGVDYIAEKLESTKCAEI